MTSNSPLLSWILSNETPFQSPNRLTSLYSDFTASRASNPDGYAANVAAWRTALQHAYRAGVAAQSGDTSNNTFVIRTGPTLAAALEKHDIGSPGALGAVQEDSLAQKHWYRREDFLQRKQSVYWKPWMGVAIPSAEDVFYSLMIRVGLAEDKRLTREGEFVILRNVEDASDKVLSRIAKQGSSPTQLVHSLETFIATFKDILADDGEADRELSMPEISILLAHLYRDKRAIDMYYSEKTRTTTVKFAKTPGTPDPIEESDDTIAHLRKLLLDLEQQTSTLQKRIEECDKTAREALRSGSGDGQRKKAMAALRTKKLANETLAKREASQAQIERVLTGIEEAAGQKDMVKAMEMSASVLEGLNKEVGGVDKVQEIMDRVADGIADVEDVNKALSEPGVNNVDENEVDEELESMMKDMEPREQAGKDGRTDLPSVPSTEPSSKEETDKNIEETRRKVGNMAI
ncbi:hypothetical protein FH972_024716 [Carpinus fangiana]|uniref:Uncharacterized protein n=1 Tax=Carpinus fangiana TaxID=176857 RepID=A0A5N6KZP7_9ROSI|nr:hypothetical protein FH972_024716 [Carpinus fangiana]